MQSSDYYDDVIDLRELVLALWNQKGVIASLMLTALVVAVVANYAITPTFESSMVVSFPATDINGAAVSPQLFKELATSNTVLTKIAEQERFSPESPHALGERIQVQLNKESTTMLVVTATGSTPEATYDLLTAWSVAFETTVKEYFSQQLRQNLASAEAIVQDRLASFSQASKKLADFERLHSISLVERNLASLEFELTSTITSLRVLAASEIPSLEQEVSYWTDVLAAEDLYLDEDVALLTLDLEGTGTSQQLIVNPIHVQAKQSLVSARHQLLLARTRHDALSAHSAELEQEIQTQRDLLVSLREERELLTRELGRLADLYTSAVARRDEIRDSLERLEATIAQLVVSPPLMPEAPVKPRKMLNMAIALFLGGFAGVVVAFVRSWWNAPETDPRATGSSDTVVPSEHHSA